MSLSAEQLAELLRGKLSCNATVAKPLGRSLASSQLHLARGPAVIWDEGCACGAVQPQHSVDSQSCGIITDRDVEIPWAAWKIHVPDVAAALQTYAAWKRQQFAGEVVAVTGPIGKSTTCRIIRHLAELRFADSDIVEQRERTTLWDTLLVLANLSSEGLAIVECDSPEQLAAANPSVAVLTAHPTSAGFGLESVVPEETLGALAAGTHLILPGNVRISDENHSAVSRITSYGREAECDISMRDVTCSRGQLSFEVQQTQFAVPVWGRFHVPAVAAAIAVAKHWQIPFLEIVTKLQKFSSHGEGCSVFHHANMTFVKDTRHDSRDSHRAAFELLRDVSAQTGSEGTGRKVPSRRVVVYESLVGTSDHDRQLSRQFGDQVISVCGADLLLAIGNNAQHVVQSALNAGMPAENANVLSDNVQAIVEGLRITLQPGDAVLFKSASPERLDKVIADLQTENRTQQMPLDSLNLSVGFPSASTV